MAKGVKTKLHLKWNMDKNKYYLYLDGQKVCRLDEAQWMLIAMHLGDKQIEGIQGPMGPAGMSGKDGKDCNCKCKEKTNEQNERGMAEGKLSRTTGGIK